MDEPRQDEQHWLSYLDDNRVLAGLAAAYGVILAALLGKLPLWRDEVFQLIVIRGESVAGILRRVTGHAGSAPLGYFLQAPFVNTMDYSAVWARLPSALLSLLCCLGLVLLARQLKMRWAGVALAVFMTLPLQFRYALEARPYSLALFLSILATILALRAAERPSALWTILYAVVAALGVYAVPYSIFVPMAHLAWAAWAFRDIERRRALVRIGLGIGAAAAAFAPWYLYSRPFLREAIAINMGHFEFTWKTPLMLLREAAGGSYWVSLPLLAAAGLGLASRRMNRQAKALLVSITAFSVLGPLAVDARFDYFLAIRQMIFMAPAVVLLGVEGLRLLYDWRKAAGAALLSGIIAAAYVYDVKWFSRPREDYELAAAAIKNTAAADGCVLYLPSDASELYQFFQPELGSRACDAGRPFPAGRQVVLAISPAAPLSEIKPLFARMREDLMVPLQRKAVGGTSITLYLALSPQPSP
jgi:hypothetical protein